MNAPARHRFAALLLLVALPVVAGGPRAVNGLGQPMAWDTGSAVAYNPDAGPLGLLSNAEARALLAEAFAVWEAGPAAIGFSEGASLGLDIDASGIPFSNPAHYQNFYRKPADGLSPVIFDDDGSIIDAIFGAGARFDIVGIAGIDSPIGLVTEIAGASIVINGAFYDGIGPPFSPEDLSLEGLKAAMVHEIGHFINLDHSVLNHELALDGNAGNDIYVPTMFPVVVTDEAALATTNPDDELAALNLYPAGPASESIAGSVAAAGVPFQGANVVLRKSDDPLMTAYSLISGGLYFPCNPASACDPCNTACDPGDPAAQGQFAADFLAAGQYEACVEQIDTRMSAANGTFVGPLAHVPILAGPEECWDLSESASQSDDPDDASDVTPDVTPAVDFVLNALPVSDPFEPNDTLGSGATLDDLPAGRDTAPGMLAGGDIDVFQIPVIAGQRLHIDVDAAELGSTLDAVVGFYDESNALVALVDDAIDLDSRAVSFDPSLELTAGFTGIGKIVISSFPDLDQDGADGESTGPYWIRVEVATDTDADGVADGEDICPLTAKDDADRDGACFGDDLCPTHFNPDGTPPGVLSGSIVPGGQVDRAQISPDGATVVYSASKDLVNAIELYSVPMLGGASTKLNSAFSAGSFVENFAISPDGTRVVYRADQDTDDVIELYSVPIGGGTAVKLNGSMPVTGDVTSFVFSADSQSVVYRADEGTDEVFTIYSAPIDGSQARVELWAATGTSDVSHQGFQISSDSLYVVYHADKDVDERFQLHAVPIGGGSPTRLDAAAFGSGVDNFTIAPDGATVVYLAEQDAVGVSEAFSIAITGGTPQKLNGALVSGGSVLQALVSPDSQTVVYLADQDTFGVIELYNVPIGGGTHTKLNENIAPGGGGVIAVRIAPDGGRVIYVADQDTAFVPEVFSVPIEGGTATKLNGPGATTDFSFPFLAVSPDSSTVVFMMRLTPDPGNRVYSAPIAGGEAVALSPTPVDDIGLTVTPDSSFVTYLLPASDLYSVPIRGGRSIRLTSAMSGTPSTHATSPAVAWLLYVSDEQNPGTNELYRVDPAVGWDEDGDGVHDGCDLCISVPDADQTDADENGVGDACDGCALGTDPDGDGLCGAADNCPTVATNAAQSDFDGDGAGDACDADDDNDGLADVVETNTGTFVDGDDTGTDPLDADSDGDGVSDGDELAGGSDPLSPAARPLHVPFGTSWTISTEASGAYDVYAADLDGDGDVDVLSASEVDDKIAWYENSDGVGSFGSQQVISTGADTARGVYAADLDGDGDFDVLSASRSDHKVAWYRNTDGAGTFSTEIVISTDAFGASSVIAADIDGDGDLDVLSAGLDGNEVAWYPNSDGLGNFGALQLISSTANGATSVHAADLDGDGDLDVVAAASYDGKFTWYENTDGAGAFGSEQVVFDGAMGAWRVSAADVDGDGDQDVLSVSWVDDKVRWHENDGTPGGLGDWSVHEVTSPGDGEGGDSVVAVDLDRDGDLDVVSTKAGIIVWYENLDGAGSFGARTTVASINNYTGATVVVADVDSDGDMDVVSAESNNLDPSNRIAWHENLTIHRSAFFVEASPVDTSADAPTAAAAGDVDGDGDLDLLLASELDDRVRWYENDGGPPAGWTARVVTATATDAADVFPADMEGDGDLDLLVASRLSGHLSWHESDGMFPPGWTARSIRPGSDSALSVLAVDLDGDGDRDVLAAIEGSGVLWFESDGASPPGFTERFIGHIDTPQPLNGPNDVEAADLDADGDIDVVGVWQVNDTLAWFENDGASPPAWTERLIASGVSADGAQQAKVADVDLDGDLDIVLVQIWRDRVVWFESNGSSPPGWTKRTIAHWIGAGGDDPVPNNPFSLYVADLDLDGDPDVASVSVSDNRLAWYENASPDWIVHVEPSVVDNGQSVIAADFDDDGDPDLVAGARDSDTVHYFENRGGQFSLTTTALAPAALVDGATATLFSIEFAHRGRPGDGTIGLEKLRFFLRSGPRLLSADEANGLIERLHLHLDDGSGAFEPGQDSAVATIENLAPSPLEIPLDSDDSRLRLNPGQSRKYFVVVEMTLDASSQTTNTFVLEHITDSASSPFGEPGSEARDLSAGVPVRMQYAANVSTPTITAVPDTTPPYIMAIFPPNGAVDLALSTDVVLFVSEPVDPQSAALGLTVSAGGVKVAGKTTISGDGTVVGFDPLAPLAVDVDYLVTVTGTLCDRAGNPAIPYSATFDTTSDASAGQYEADEFGETAGGATVEGGAENDHSGFAIAALGDVNGTLASHGIADLIIGAPNAGVGDWGRATIVFGSPGLQSNAGAVTTLVYETGGVLDRVGETVAGAGDHNGDGVRDFLVGAPHADRSFTDAGVVYLVFGDAGLDEVAPGPLDLDDLAACGAPTLCGVEFRGAAPDELAGAAISYAGDVNGDGADDIVIGAPGASPGGKLEAGRAYLVYGPLAPGIRLLSDVGGSVPGLVFNGESAGDRLGAAVSQWEDTGGGDGIDDLLLAAPGATALDEFGTPLPEVGYVYAIQGGTGPGKLVDADTPGVIELGRVANAGADQVAGMVFVGAEPNGELGRSLTGAADTNGDGIDDVLLAGNGFAFAIPGDDPKRIIGSTQTGGQNMSLGLRTLGGLDAHDDLGALRYTTGDTDPLTIGPAGDLDNDGVDDFIVGAPLADGTAGVDSGKAYVVLGSAASVGGERDLDDVGSTIAGFAVEGAGAGDNLGASVGGGFDVNADGVDDGLAGAPFADSGLATPENSGEAYVISPINPDEVMGLVLADLGGGTVRLEWSVPGLAASYNVYRGLLSALASAGEVRTSAMTQAACGIADDADADELPDYDDATGPPPAGDAFFWLITARNPQGEGSIGPPGVEPARFNDAQCP